MAKSMTIQVEDLKNVAMQSRPVDHPPQQFNDDTAGQMVEEYIADAALAAE